MTPILALEPYVDHGVFAEVNKQASGGNPEES